MADTTLSAEDRAYRLEEVLKKEEDRIHEAEKELNRLREKQVCDLTYFSMFLILMVLTITTSKTISKQYNSFVRINSNCLRLAVSTV